MSAKVVLYMSSVAGNLETKRHQSFIQNLFTAKKIPFTSVDVSLPENEEAKSALHSASGKTTLPQVFVNDQFCALYDEIFDANECGTLRELLGL